MHFGSNTALGHIIGALHFPVSTLLFSLLLPIPIFMIHQNMPSTLLFPNIIQTDNRNISSIMVNECPLSPSSSIQGDQSWINFLSSAIALGRQRKHGEKGCQQCDTVALYYRQALMDSKQHNMDELVLELVWQMTKMLMEHMETRLYHQLGWFGIMAQDLYQYAKWLKEDREEGDMENAIRITIYHCRAAIHQHDGDLNKARLYYQKCLALSTEFETQLSIQHAASVFVSRHPLTVSTPSLIHSSNSDYSYFSLPPSLQSPSSVSSTPSSVSVSSSSSLPFLTHCGYCGMEKKAMPVCAKCKSQRYCSSRCLKDHQSTHALVCQKKSVSP
ncbi:hypothetical protein [Absidia glauca]|uniref:MYND-type domain-containing protein n=1 Tax=Absidia glauca TaxID=4829 RepID=A0A163JAU9_ABSGL|nr:hypothetical protein [Absidia glauca]